MLEFALRKGADPNYKRSYYDKTPLWDIKTPEQLKLLHEYGADIQFVSKYGQTYLSLAYPNILFAHAELGGNFKNGRRLLDDLCETRVEFLIDERRRRYEYKRIIDLMIKNGLNIDEHNSYGIAPIHYAVICLCYPIVECLVELGVDCTIKTTKDYTFLDEVFIPKASSVHEIIQMREAFGQMENEENIEVSEEEKYPSGWACLEPTKSIVSKLK